MALLISGLILWSVVHLIPSLVPSVSLNCKSRLGENGYKLIFSVLILVSMALIIFGWRSTDTSYIYSLPTGFRGVFLLLILIAFILFGASTYATRIKRLMRHPQLTGIMLWAGAHLLLNGDSRSILLFGGLGIWALLEIIFISRREGAWVKPLQPGWMPEIKGLAVSLVIFAVIVMLHPYLAGVPVR